MPGYRHADTPLDLMVVTALCFGWFIVASVLSVMAGFPAQPFSDAALIGVVLIELVFGSLALGYLRFRGYELRALFPRPTIPESVFGVGLYVASAVASWIFVAALLPHDVAEQTQPVEEMVNNATISAGPVIGASLINGMYEEVFLIGYLQRALQSSGASFAIGVSLLVRVLYHLYQGPMGAISVLGFGLILSIYYVRTKRLWPIVVAHILADVLAFAAASS